MEVNWRPLLDSLKRPWRDRGKNTSAGNVNICCPFCKDDHGYHLSIAEDKAAYYCYRAPDRHSGTNQVSILVKLGLDRAEAVRLLNRHRSNKPTAIAERMTREGRDPSRRWETFDNASSSSRALAYLGNVRGFPDPEWLARFFDLRISRAGTWAGRILMPIKLDGTLMTWHGRSIVPEMEPKYLAEAKGEEGKSMLYVPDLSIMDQPGNRAVIVEGQMDALKIASARIEGVQAVALVGKSYGTGKLLALKRILKHSTIVSVALDGDAGLGESMRLISTLGQLGLTARITRKGVPDAYKDAGEMDEGAIREWMRK